MLGGYRFFNVFFVRFTAWGSWFSRTAHLSLQKALFYKVSMLKCYCGSRTVLSVVLPCWAGIVFSMQFLPFRFRIDFRIDQGFDRKRFRRGIETRKLEVSSVALSLIAWQINSVVQFCYFFVALSLIAWQINSVVQFRCADGPTSTIWWLGRRGRGW